MINNETIAFTLEFISYFHQDEPVTTKIRISILSCTSYTLFSRPMLNDELRLFLCFSAIVIINACAIKIKLTIMLILNIINSFMLKICFEDT